MNGYSSQGLTREARPPHRGTMGLTPPLSLNLYFHFVISSGTHIHGADQLPLRVNPPRNPGVVPAHGARVDRTRSEAGHVQMEAKRVFASLGLDSTAAIQGELCMNMRNKMFLLILI